MTFVVLSTNVICCTLSAPIPSACSSALVNISISDIKAAHSFKSIGAFERAALRNVHANGAYLCCKSTKACGCCDTRVIRITIIYLIFFMCMSLFCLCDVSRFYSSIVQSFSNISHICSARLSVSQRHQGPRARKRTNHLPPICLASIPGIIQLQREI